ncbi:MAG: 4Fe-4S binding protein [Sphingobacteriales bacterium]|nr:4Fe-4S binding protein [Sphingobacteriales bacterium]
MKQQLLRPIRLFFAILTFISIAFIFTDIWQLLSPSLSRSLLFFQFIPSLTGLFTGFSVFAFGFIVIILITFLFGRIYCSFLCLLGVLIDLISSVSGFFRKIRYRFTPPKNFWRYAFLTASVLSLLSGSMLLIDLLDPYSNAGRIFTNLLRPAVIGVNNLISGILSEIHFYSLQRVAYHFPNPVAVVFPLAFLMIITLFALLRGRLYCNTVCPVGTLLGLISRLSVFRIKINASSCTVCGKCVSVCKSECINVNNLEVDMSRCVGCMNCLKSCNFSAIGYKEAVRGKNQEFTNVDTQKRNFLKKLTIGGGAIMSISARHGYSPYNNRKAGSIPVKKNYPCSPPGSVSISHFTAYCTACHLCVSVCPTQVLQPALFQYGLEGILQPFLDPGVNFCNFDCVACSEVCPSGAIRPLTVEKKHVTQVGKVHFIRQSCVVSTNRKDCGACSEHCPTKAVQMVHWQHGLKIPEINQDLCVGCGACEFACPTIPYKAIYVDGNPVHLTARKPEKTETNEGFNPENDFPF